MRPAPLVAAFLALGLCACHNADPQRTETMLREIATMTRFSVDYTGISNINPSVVTALRSVDRSEFVPVEQRRFAFANQPLEIGHGQTISQPFIVALMTHVLELEPTDSVLEIGTGSGYQAAILGELVDKVYTIEIVEPLAREAETRLLRLGYDNVFVRLGDGWFGWPENAPFDKIMVTAVAPKLPPELISQLKEGGKMVLPVGDYDGYQELVLVEKASETELNRRVILPVRFVPMTGEAAQFD
ncbi:MAG: protein-L-isoaspartate(D-aspartate) O-methyltransferase [Gammaproteobacteria bacterium]|nr:protein-L-isoaspartate(D-aspartate) O-methyltransferase [Gammaproteobacteria bacterium]